MPCASVTGPIVRINPDELYIQDSDFYEELYSRVARRDKYEHDAGRLGNNTSIFTTSDHNLHALRRSCLNAMFSKTGNHQLPAYYPQEAQVIV